VAQNDDTTPTLDDGTNATQDGGTNATQDDGTNATLDDGSSVTEDVSSGKGCLYCVLYDPLMAAVSLHHQQSR